MNCNKCKDNNLYAVANQPDGSYVCYSCRGSVPQKPVIKRTIPSTLDECINELLRTSQKEDIDLIMNGTEDDMIQFHSTVGMWIRNNWGLWTGGPLQDHFKSFGLHHPDDMSGIILCSFYRHLRGIPLDVLGQVNNYLDYWKNRNLTFSP